MSDFDGYEDGISERLETLIRPFDLFSKFLWLGNTMSALLYLVLAFIIESSAKRRFSSEGSYGSLNRFRLCHSLFTQIVRLAFRY